VFIIVQQVLNQNQIRSGPSIRAVRSRVSRVQLREMHHYAKFYTPAADQLAERIGSLTDEGDLAEVAWSASSKFARTIATGELAKRVDSLHSFRSLIIVSEQASNVATQDRAIERLEALGKHGCIIEPILD